MKNKLNLNTCFALSAVAGLAMGSSNRTGGKGSSFDSKTNSPKFKKTKHGTYKSKKHH